MKDKTCKLCRLTLSEIMAHWRQQHGRSSPPECARVHQEAGARTRDAPKLPDCITTAEFDVSGNPYYNGRAVYDAERLALSKWWKFD